MVSVETKMFFSLEQVRFENLSDVLRLECEFVYVLLLCV